MLSDAELDAIKERANAAAEQQREWDEYDWLSAALTSVADVPALVAEVRRLREALQQIADSSMPDDWHPDNIAWWLRGIARTALRQPEWMAPPYGRRTP